MNSLYSDVIDEWLLTREYMRTIFAGEAQSDLPIHMFLNKCSLSVEAKIIDIKEKNGDILYETDNILAEKSSLKLSKEELFLFRVMKFLRIEVKMIQQKLGTASEELMEALKNDFQSIEILVDVYEEISKELHYNKKSMEELFLQYINDSLQRMYPDLLKSELYITNKISSLKVQSSDNSSQNAPDQWTFPITEEMQQYFNDLVSDPNFPLYSEIERVIEEFGHVTAQIFSQRMEIVSLNIMKSLKGEVDHKAVNGCFASYIFQCIYSRNHRLLGLLQESHFMPGHTASKVVELGLTPILVDFSRPELTVKELVAESGDLKEALGHVACAIFEWSPVGILMRIDACLECIRRYMTNLMAKNGVAAAFVPFDDTFMLFTAVLSAAGVPAAKGMAAIACDYIREKMLPNNLAYAQMILKSAMEYQEKSGGKEK